LNNRATYRGFKAVAPTEERRLDGLIPGQAGSQRELQAFPPDPRFHGDEGAGSCGKAVGRLPKQESRRLRHLADWIPACAGASALLILLFALPAFAETPGVERLIREYYDRILTGKAVSWEVEIRRSPELKPNQTILRVRGEEKSETPRGSRICWLDVQEGSRSKPIPVTLRVKPVERTPVARQDIDPRTPITPDLIEWRILPTEKFGATHIAGAEDLDGAWAKVRIPAGTVITGRRIAPMPKVVIGEPIKLVIKIGRIEATAEGKALEDGRVGEKIRVLNLASGFRLRGEVCEDGSVEIQ